MCGIVGILNYNNSPPDQKQLQNACIALKNRGPDSRNIYVQDNVGLGHSRLSIIDTSKLSHQPMRGANGTVIVFNGEIYNYKEIRERLKGKYNFERDSDTETILALYQDDPANFVHELRGMFSFALYDPQFKRLILARDPFGIKPLFIHEAPDSLSFASEIKALKCFQDIKLDTSHFKQLWFKSHYFMNDYVAYTGVSKLRPGEVRTYENGAFSGSYFIDPLPNKFLVSAEKDVMESFEELFLDTVNKHTVSDVGYGVFLSGGTDSTAICAGLHALGVASVKTYTACFVSPHARNEHEIAQKTAKAFNFDHQTITVDEDEFWKTLPEIAAYMDEPVADYAIIPTWLLAKEASKDQKVVLCGEGGDEILAGYGRYKSRFWKDWKQKLEPKQTRKEIQTWTRLQKKQARDIFSYLPNDLLVKLDMCLMAHGLEGRTPFLDPVFSPYAFHLPDKLKRKDQHGKYILKKWLSEKLPNFPTFAKKKGFTVPVGDWIEARRSYAEDVVKESVFLKELLSAKELSSILSLNSKSLWPYLYLAYWSHNR